MTCFVFTNTAIVFELALFEFLVSLSTLINILEVIRQSPPSAMAFLHRIVYFCQQSMLYGNLKSLIALSFIIVLLYNSDYIVIRQFVFLFAFVIKTWSASQQMNAWYKYVIDGFCSEPFGGRVHRNVTASASSYCFLGNFVSRYILNRMSFIIPPPADTSSFHRCVMFVYGVKTIVLRQSQQDK